MLTCEKIGLEGKPIILLPQSITALNLPSTKDYTYIILDLCQHKPFSPMMGFGHPHRLTQPSSILHFPYYYEAFPNP